MEKKTRDAVTAMDLGSWVLHVAWLDEFPNLNLFVLKTDSQNAKPSNSEMFSTDSRPEMHSLNSIITGKNIKKLIFNKIKVTDANKKSDVFWNAYP